MNRLLVIDVDAMYHVRLYHRQYCLRRACSQSLRSAQRRFTMLWSLTLLTVFDLLTVPASLRRFWHMTMNDHQTNHRGRATVLDGHGNGVLDLI
jgi:hypothetical protein